MDEMEFNQLQEIYNNPKVLSQKEKFLATLPKNDRPVFEAILRRKEIQAKEKKQSAKDIASLTREIMETDYIKLDDDTSITMAEMHLAVAMSNNLKNTKLGFKEINDIQKVINNDIEDNRGGITVIVNTNGQDLGD